MYPLDETSPAPPPRYPSQMENAGKWIKKENICPEGRFISKGSISSRKAANWECEPVALSFCPGAGAVGSSHSVDASSPSLFESCVTAARRQHKGNFVEKRLPSLRLSALFLINRGTCAAP